MTRNSLPPSIIRQLPSSPISSNGHSVATVTRVFSPTSSDSQNLERLLTFHKSLLVKTASTLMIRYYDNILDADKLNTLGKPKVASILLNKLKSLLPQKCEECKGEYSLPLDDNEQASRKYCFICCTPSHTCNPHPTTNPNPTWICGPCMINIAGPHIQILKLNPLGLPHYQTSPSTPGRVPPAPTSQSTPNLSNQPSPSAPSLSQLSPPRQNPAPSAPPYSQLSPTQTLTPSAPPSSQVSTPSKAPTPSAPPYPQMSSPSQGPLPSVPLSPELSTPIHTPPTKLLIPSPTPTSVHLKQEVPPPQPRKSALCENMSINEKKCSALIRELKPTHQSPEKSDPTIKICPYLEKGICLFGLSGKKNGKCPFFHPSACIPYTIHGSFGIKGCHKGFKCQKWHPHYLCKSSAIFKSCSNMDCPYFHHKGCSRPSNQRGQNFLLRTGGRPIPPLLPVPYQSTIPNRLPRPTHPNHFPSRRNNSNNNFHTYQYWNPRGTFQQARPYF